MSHVTHPWNDYLFLLSSRDSEGVNNNYRATTTSTAATAGISPPSLLAFPPPRDSTRLNPFSAVNNDDQIHSGRTARPTDRPLRGGLLCSSLLFSLAFGRCDLPSEAATLRNHFRLPLSTRSSYSIGGRSLGDCRFEFRMPFPSPPF